MTQAENGVWMYVRQDGSMYHITEEVERGMIVVKVDDMRTYRDLYRKRGGRF